MPIPGHGQSVDGHGEDLESCDGFAEDVGFGEGDQVVGWGDTDGEGEVPACGELFFAEDTGGWELVLQAAFEGCGELQEGDRRGDPREFPLGGVEFALWGPQEFDGAFVMLKADELASSALVASVVDLDKARKETPPTSTKALGDLFVKCVMEAVHGLAMGVELFVVSRPQRPHAAGSIGGDVVFGSASGAFSAAGHGASGRESWAQIDATQVFAGQAVFGSSFLRGASLVGVFGFA